MERQHLATVTLHRVTQNRPEKSLNLQIYFRDEYMFAPMPIDDYAIALIITRYIYRLIETQSTLNHLHGRCLIVAAQKRGSACLRATREPILRRDCKRDFGDSLLAYLQANLIAFGRRLRVSQSTAIHPIRLAVAERRSHPSRQERLTGSEWASSHCLYGLVQGGDSCRDHPVQH